jgi:hypothetical protein
LAMLAMDDLAFMAFSFLVFVDGSSVS